MENKKIENWILILMAVLVVFDALVWGEIIFNSPNVNPEIYFLNVGQGDSEMIVFPGNVKVLIDGGPNKKILENIPKILSYFDRRIDLVIMSHAQADHFGGLLEILKRYRVGAFVWSGIKNDTESFRELQKVLDENNILQIIIAENDKIKYQNNDLRVIYPPQNIGSIKDINDAALVLKFESKNGSALFMADIGKKIEQELAAKYDLSSDILKVGHHGSKYSSFVGFLNEVNPKISVIEVGKNSYGHPSKDALARLADAGSKIFRTDKNGIIKLVLSDDKINVFAEK